MNYYEHSVLPQQGWQCPICKRIMSPITPFCPCEGKGGKTYYTTNIEEPQNNKTEVSVNNEAKPM